MVAQWYDLRDTGDPSSNPVGQAAAERSHDYPIDVPAATPTLSNANLRYQETLNGQKDSDAASFFCPRSFDRAVMARVLRTGAAGRTHWSRSTAPGVAGTAFTASEPCWRLAAGRPGRTDK